MRRYRGPLTIAASGAVIVTTSPVVTRPPAPDLSAWSPEDWATLAQGVTTSIAVIAAIFAFFQVREARRTREDQSRPFVIVDIQPSQVWSNILNLVIENTGTTLARNVVIDFEPPLKTTINNYDIASSLLMTNGIPSLPPGRKLSALFDLSHDRLKAGLPLRFQARVSLDDARGRPQETLEYVIDLEFLYGLEQITEYGMHHVAEALREIENRVSEWSGRAGRLNVWTRNEDVLNRSEQIERDMTGSYPTQATQAPSELLMAVGQNTIARLVWRRLRAWREARPRPRSKT